MRFSASSRLTEGRDFARVREQGRSVQGRLLRIGTLNLGTPDTSKAGIITSKRVGGAVVRNKVRRRLRELIRPVFPDFPAGLLIVVIAKQPAASATFEELRGEWLLLLRRLSILPDLP
jgi:ribonuclease P protein component